jgi:DNA-binding protein HU-beta
MTKQELVEAVANEANITKADALRAVNATFDVIAEALKNGQKVSLVGFGTFSTKERAAREGINPLTKEKISIPAKTAVSFKVGSKLKEAVNN